MSKWGERIFSTRQLGMRVYIRIVTVSKINLEFKFMVADVLLFLTTFK
jgi:hypothetical protein